MLKLKITKNGRTIPINRLADEMMKDVRASAEKQIREDLQRRLRTVHCAEHANAVRDVRVTMGRNDHGKVSVDTCCDAIRPDVETILGKSSS